MSCKAREDVFKMFVNGASVREISRKYGIIPERVKAIVWLRRTYYDEIMPKLDL